MIDYSRMLNLLENNRYESSLSEEKRRVLVNGKKIDEKFWHHFGRVLSDWEGVASLLEVEPSTVRSWSGKIRSAIDRLDWESQHDPLRSQKNQIIPTGDS